jgi:hypothetical protein
MFGANPIQYFTEYTLDIFKQSGGCIMLWVYLSLLRTGEFFRIKKLTEWSKAHAKF